MSYCSIDRVTDFIYVGNEVGAGNKMLLQNAGVTHIVIAGKRLKPFFPGEFVYKQIPVYDAPYENILKFFNNVNSFIDSAVGGKGKVFIHCHQGISRGPTLTIAYLMFKQQLDFEEAHSLVKRTHIDSAPNNGFLQQLRQYERILGLQNPVQVRHGNCRCIAF